MLRAVLGSAAVALMCVGSLAAADKAKNASADHNASRECKVLFVQADPAHNTITFLKIENDKRFRTDKGVEVTMPLAKDAKILGQDNKPESLTKLAAHLSKKADQPIVISEDKDGKHVTEVKDVSSMKAK